MEFFLRSARNTCIQDEIALILPLIIILNVVSKLLYQNVMYVLNHFITFKLTFSPLTGVYLFFVLRGEMPMHTSCRQERVGLAPT